jgi:hypothetical protein
MPLLAAEQTMWKDGGSPPIICRTNERRVVVGERVWLLSEQSCPASNVESIQDHDNPVESINAIEGQELGLRSPSLPKEGTRIVRLVPLPPNAVPLNYAI